MPRLPDGFELIKYKTHRSSSSEWLHPYLRRFEDAVLEGQAAYRAALKLKQEKWYPDVIITMQVLAMVSIFQMLFLMRAR